MRLLFLALTVACGAAAEPPPPAVHAAPEPQRYTVVIDGLRGGRVLDERGGFRLLEGAGTVGLVDAAGHVRSAHRVSYGGDVDGRFVTDDLAVLCTNDADGFVGPWSNTVVLFDLATDELEVLGSAEECTIGRLGDHVLVATGDGMHEVTAQGWRSVGWGTEITCGADYCLSETAADAELIRLEDGSLVFTPTAHPTFAVGAGYGLVEESDDTYELVHLPDGSPVEVPDAPTDLAPRFSQRRGTTYVVGYGRAGEYVAQRYLVLPDLVWRDTLPDPTSVRDEAVADLGARGIPTVAFAPRSLRLLLGSAANLVVLGPDGIEHELDGSGQVDWSPTELVLQVGGRSRPLALVTRPTASSVARPVYEGTLAALAVPELTRFADWAETTIDEPPAPFPPVCGPTAAGERCVRSVIDLSRRAVTALEVFDPTSPSRVLLRVASDLPAAPATLLVRAHHVRVVGLDGAVQIISLDGGATVRAPARRWVESELGWVASPAPHRLVRISSDGALAEGELPEEIEALTLAEGDRVVLRTAHAAIVVAEATLETLDTYPLESDAPSFAWRCERGALENDRGSPDDAPERIPHGCPQRHPHDAFPNAPVFVSADRSLFTESLGDVVALHRVGSLPATIYVRLTTEGVLAYTDDGVFEASGAIGEHVLLRAPGPLMTAPILVGEDTARFARPGLLRAFFRDEPLPGGA